MNDDFSPTQNETTFLQCDTCFCSVTTRDAEKVCRSCRREPLPNNTFEYCNDFITCHGCDVILCPFHLKEVNFENALCDRCLTGCLSDDENDDEDDDEEEEKEDYDYLNVLQASFNEAPPAKRRKLTVGIEAPYVKIKVDVADVNCCICMECLDGEAAQLKCHDTHLFHVACIDLWFLECSSCPICQMQF